MSALYFSTSLASLSQQSYHLTVQHYRQSTDYHSDYPLRFIQRFIQQFHDTGQQFDCSQFPMLTVFLTSTKTPNLALTLNTHLQPLPFEQVLSQLFTTMLTFISNIHVHVYNKLKKNPDIDYRLS